MTVQIEQGQLYFYRLFDVADFIHLARVEELLKSNDTKRLDFKRFPKTQLSIPVPPLSFGLNSHALIINNKNYTLEMSVRVFDFGVISICAKHVLKSNIGLQEVLDLNGLLAEHVLLETQCKQTAQQIYQWLMPAMTKPLMSGLVEDYTIFYVEKILGVDDIQQLATEPLLAKIILNESSLRGISQEALSDATQFCLSYYADELTIIDWNSAFIYDPCADTDIPDMIEFTSAQLLELRSYDALLDREIHHMYQALSSARGFFKKRHMRALTQRLLRVVIETTELSERIDNSLKWVGDLYLAHVYQACVAQFNTARWRDQVTHKLGLISRINDLLMEQINTDRSMLLEFSIFILIMVELILTLIRYVN